MVTVVWFVVEFVWPSTESNVPRAVNMTTKISKITMVIGILIPIFIVRIYQCIIFNLISFHRRACSNHVHSEKCMKLVHGGVVQSFEQSVLMRCVKTVLDCSP